MDVIQRNASGGICHITSTDISTDTISQSVHHYGIPYSLVDVPVLTSCGSRVFSARIFVHLLSGDDVKIDGSIPYTNKDGTSFGGTRTEVMAVNSTLTAVMPDVVGQFQDAATAAVEAAGLRVAPDYIGA
jgi:hypothetical protein